MKKCLTAHWSRWIQIGCVVNYWSSSKGWRVSISSRAASATCFAMEKRELVMEPFLCTFEPIRHLSLAHFGAVFLVLIVTNSSFLKLLTLKLVIFGLSPWPNLARKSIIIFFSNYALSNWSFSNYAHQKYAAFVISMVDQQHGRKLITFKARPKGVQIFLSLRVNLIFISYLPILPR